MLPKEFLLNKLLYYNFKKKSQGYGLCIYEATHFFTLNFSLDVIARSWIKHIPYGGLKYILSGGYKNEISYLVQIKLT